MALCRCLEVHAWPKGRTKRYVGYAKPVGYPQTALICGLCDRPGFIWLDDREVEAYEKGQRIFRGPSYVAQMRANDDGIHN